MSITDSLSSSSPVGPSSAPFLAIRRVGAQVDDDRIGVPVDTVMWGWIMDRALEFESFAEEAVASWGRSSGDYGPRELEAAIATLYRSHVEFPPIWTDRQRDEFIVKQASRDASEVGASFDDLIDTVTDRVRRDRYLDCGGQPLNEDIAAEIDLARGDVIDGLRWRMVVEIPNAIRQVDRELAAEMVDRA
ncbi:Putative transposase [Mycobacteroides abscessus subsp. massiliense]|nr:Putative transposase [Mycobacteroides abscessus subsp. massiliense]SKN19990.1 Putative transposase [Mycobacteroides abscessus subsp. massiliense]SKN50784.1 Putative transposase [Mycobacteroides abscessus subsp. massiliense]SKN90968.1 Putative transposase [Mycobacteroides abscessus subsp. massiliense]SKO51021.1 Putative transposase [Mycobacteroides abscessus subsp. massiliense]